MLEQLRLLAWHTLQEGGRGRRLVGDRKWLVGGGKIGKTAPHAEMGEGSEVMEEYNIR
jgi:hypothetical protein